ncbi:hypothetical protein J5N97_022784 [Dioscorea zingiberensis]|uniref:Uncharacterized protein n=1 Tax=Dioscorea zingiberensis TaxID=325984 RepID=A0A9D5CB42_9LILI|nr:hypothetical protein J5N97_022784 [Dioscorea zingiberensis]
MHPMSQLRLRFPHLPRAEGGQSPALQQDDEGGPTEEVQPPHREVQDLIGHIGEPEGAISLLLALDSPPQVATVLVSFMVVRCPLSYNVILRRPFLNLSGVVISTDHLKLKFPTEARRGEIRGDQSISHQCYATMLRNRAEGSSKATEALTVEEMQGEDEKKEVRRPTPVEDLKVLPLEEALRPYLSTLEFELRSEL